jgi:hypothetical protein
MEKPSYALSAAAAARSREPHMLTSGIELMDGRDLLTDINSIPNKTGVYSWYRRLSINDVSEAAFKKTLADRMRTPMLSCRRS